MAQARAGDTVRLHYTGKRADGSTFDSSSGREPLEFQLGAGQVIPGFGRAVEGMTTGEKKTVNLISSDAYGPRREELVGKFARSDIPDHLQPELGQRLRAKQDDGGSAVVTCPGRRRER